MKIRSQAGFTLVEGLLTIIAISLVAFVGFYVYSAQTESDKTASDSTKAVNSAATAEATKDRFLNIKELGVKIPLEDGLTDITYEMSQGDSATAVLSTKSFNRAVEDCRTAGSESQSNPALGVVTKKSGTPGADADMFEQFTVPFEGFYLSYSTPDGGPALYCTVTDEAKIKAVEDLFNSTTTPLQAAVKGAKTL